MTTPQTIAAIATLPDRVEVLRGAVVSLLHQVDGIRVYLNGHKTVPDFLKHPKIEVVMDAHNQGDAVKYHWVEKHNGYYFTCDDDLVYPPNYIRTLKAKIELYGRQAVVGVHGKRLRFPIRGYHNGQHTTFHSFAGLERDAYVHVMGTGLSGFHTDTIRVRMVDFPQKFRNMGDIHMALIAQKQKVPLIVIARLANWIKYNKKMKGKKTIFDEKKNGRDKSEVRRLTSYKSWNLHEVK